MKLSWTSIKISIAGAKLSHLVQKDRIWDHGSMAEQARIIFYLVHKARVNGNFESLQKQCSVACFEKLRRDLADFPRDKRTITENPVLKEIAVIDVQPGKNNKPDMFCAMMKGYLKNTAPTDADDHSEDFIVKWCFIRQGEWWVLDEIRS